MRKKYLSPQRTTIDVKDLFYDQTDSRIIYGEDKHIPLLSKIVPYLPLADNYCMEGYCDIPIVPVFNMDITNDVIPLDKIRSNHDHNTGVHGFVSDVTISRIVNNIYGYLDLLREHPFVIAPEFSSYSALPKMMNLVGVFQSRNVTCFLHEHGIPTIPCFTFSTFDSIEYSMLGIPMNSTVAVGNHVIGRHPIQREVAEKAVQRLIEVKHPTKLVVYGEPFGFNMDVDVVQIESRIQKLRKLSK